MKIGKVNSWNAYRSSDWEVWLANYPLLHQVWGVAGNLQRDVPCRSSNRRRWWIWTLLGLHLHDTEEFFNKGEAVRCSTYLAQSYSRVFHFPRQQNKTLILPLAKDNDELATKLVQLLECAEFLLRYWRCQRRSNRVKFPLPLTLNFQCHLQLPSQPGGSSGLGKTSAYLKLSVEAFRLLK